MTLDFFGWDFDLGFIADDEGRVFAGPASRVDLQASLREEVWPRQTDVNRVTGKANLIQALITRLQTEQGELAALGHPNYGSRHHRLIGEPNTEGNRNLIRLYVLECLRQEPRLEKIARIEVRPGQGRQNRDKVEIELTLKAKGAPDPLILVVPFSFEGPLT